jgi:HD-like signal output (HDOD) protein
LITQEQIEEYIDKVPPMPDSLRECIKLLRDGEIAKASKQVEDDPALNNYLVHIVNKPIYGFVQEVTSTPQIFSILGVVKTNQILTSYLVSLLAPKKWELFKIDNIAFNEFQATMMANWNKILGSLSIEDHAINTSATLLASAIIVCEELFKDRADAVTLIRERNNIDYNTILKQLGGVSLFDVAIMIGKKWHVEEKALNIIKYSDGKSKCPTGECENMIKVSKYLHLLLFHSLSTPTFVEHGLNDFIEFNPEFVMDIYEDFINVIPTAEEVPEEEEHEADY